MKKLFLLFALPAILSLTACATTPKKTDPASSTTTPTQTTQTTEITAAEFKTKIADYTNKEWKFLGDKPAVVDFYATWCGPCKQIAPILNELAAKYEGKVNFYKIDVDQAPEVATAYGISSIPALLFIPTGDKKPILQAGAYPKDVIENLVQNILNN